MKKDDHKQRLRFDSAPSESSSDKHFNQWFSALTDSGPFIWQKKLFRRFLKNDIPSALDIPTGLGKTSVMTIWLLARALNPLLPRRLVYIVDRRVVVDQATAIAVQVRDRLVNNPDCAPIAEKLGFDHTTPLPISTLRGQLADNRLWLENPASMAIVIGTVDMIGSRLLFSGYRASRWMRPVHAALLGVDSLIVLDEAHLVPAFHRILTHIETQRQHEISSIAVPPLRVLPLSATSQPSKGADLFRLDEEDRKDKAVADRIGAIKRLKFVDIDSKLSDVLSERALAHDSKSRTVVVFCNGRDDAQKTAETLRKQLGKDRNSDVRLLTGARRGHERDELATHETFKAFQHDYPKDGRTRFLVCTAAGEVGADLDAEHAVMDLVPLERMVQRLGRINRRGEFSGGSDIEVLVNRAQLDTEEKGKRLSSREARHRRYLISLLTKSDQVYDASPGAMEALLKHLGTRCRKLLWTPDPPSPTFDCAHVEAWSMTSLAEHPGRPEVAPFLRGMVDEKPQTEVVWRADVSFLSRLSSSKIAQALEAVPPHPSEILKEEASSVAKKLLGRMEQVFMKEDAADGAASPPFSLIVTRGDKVIEVLRISTTDRKRMLGTSRPWPSDPKKQEEELTGMLAYSTVWLPCTFGGLDSDGLFAINASQGEEPPRDAFSSLRLTVALNTKTATPLPQGWPAGIDLEGDWEGQLRMKNWRRIFAASLPGEDDDDDDPIQCLEYWVPPKASYMDGETGAAPQAQSLTEHHQWIEAEVAFISDALKLPEWLKNVLRVAARRHDSGKGRELWQHAMRADRESDLVERPLAKTGNKGSGNLGSYRHEFGSLIDAFGHDDLLSVNEEHRDLVLHLIAAHHGRARPCIPGIDPDIIVSAALEEKALAAAQRFVRMQRQWGPWGLAWLESLLRAADVNASRRLEEYPT